MPCPFFIPEAIAAVPHNPGGRLPLIDEYTGHCAAAPHSLDLPLLLCNAGYSRGECQHMSAVDVCSAMRYSILAETGGQLRVLCIEETDHWPVRWYEVEYAAGCVHAAGVSDVICAQVKAFCESQLRRASEPCH